MLKKNEAIGIPEGKKQKLDVLNVHQSWCEYSRSRDYPEMYHLCLCDSKFSELTNVYGRSIGLGIFYHYEVADLNIIQISTNSATVIGFIRLIQSGQKLIFEGQFKSSCKFLNNEWMLDDIEIEWKL